MNSKILAIGFCLFLGLGAAKLHAQKASIYNRDGKATSFFLSDIRKISFSEGSLSVKHRNGEVIALVLADLSVLDFRDFSSGEQQLETKSHPASFALYPNPVSEILTLDLSAGPEAAGSLQILSIEGKIIYRETIHKHRSIYKINFSSLEKGIYIIQVKRGASFRTAKVIKH